MRHPAETPHLPASSNPSRNPTAWGWAHWPARRSRRLLFLSVYLLFCWGLFWGAARAYWQIVAAVSWTQKPSVWDQHYPRIRWAGLVDNRASRDDTRFDLLLLGGSVLEPAWGTVEAELERHLESLIPGRVRICNLSQGGFTSRDSLIQYEHLDRDRFDLVIVYDGINDVRMNCCPPELFRDDYTHFQWYNGMARRMKSGSTSLTATAFDQLLTTLDSIPLGTPDPRLLDYAASPQTPRTLRHNLEEIARFAEQRGDPLLILTYAWHIPPEYSLQRFSDGSLDYSQTAKARCAVEQWGRPEHVVRALELQNAEIRQLAASHPGIRFVDQFERLPRRGENFVDPCHLTPAGCAAFVDGIWPEVERAVHASPAWLRIETGAVPNASR